MIRLLWHSDVGIVVAGSKANRHPAASLYVRGYVVDWSRSPFIGGAYSYPSLGARIGDRCVCFTNMPLCDSHFVNCFQQKFVYSSQAAQQHDCCACLYSCNLCERPPLQ